MQSVRTPSHFHYLRMRHRRAIAALHPHSETGMTLVEIMIVLTIMASMMAIVGFYAVGALANARIRTAEVETGKLAEAIDVYYVTFGELPDALEDLTDPPGAISAFIEVVPLDPWGNDYQYETTSRDHYDLFSMGADGVSDSDDDVIAGAR